MVGIVTSVKSHVFLMLHFSFVWLPDLCNAVLQMHHCWFGTVWRRSAVRFLSLNAALSLLWRSFGFCVDILRYMLEVAAELRC